MEMKMIPEVIAASDECPNPWAWRCYDGMATEVEVIELLASLVRALKPMIVVETGTYKGLCTVRLAEAVRVNGFGRVFTAEPFDEVRLHAEALADECAVRDFIDFRATTGEQLIKSIPYPIGFAFLDSSAEGRLPELLALVPRLSPNAIVAVHDTHSRPDSLRSRLHHFANGNGFRFLQLATPRGLTLLQHLD